MTTTPKKPKRTRTNRSPDQWQVLFDRFESSGQSREQFCHEQGISLHSFNRWRTKLLKRTPGDPSPTTSPLFSELTSAVPPPPTAWDIELQLGADIVLRLRRAC
jgi:hypothetical protein